MTDNEIIKCAKDCVGNFPPCSSCPFDEDLTTDECMGNLMKELLGVNDRQQTEIERLTAEIEETNEADREAELQALKESKENAKLFCEAINHAKSEAIKEFAEKITEVFMRYAHLHNYADQARVAEVESADGTKIELFSVWDVLTLKKHEMAEYEEMGELQHNIEYIANDRLLTEIEKEFRLIVKEMTTQPTKIEHNSLCETETYKTEQ